MSETKSAVKEAMDAWGREFLSGEGFDVLEDADIEYDEEESWSGGCETCGYDEYYVVVSDGTNNAKYSGSLSDLLWEMNH